jgi:hypothetical protein
VPDASALSVNPFAALTAVAGPAVLTNACSVLALGTSNRLARVVDRSRTVSRELASFQVGTTEYELRAGQRRRLAARAQLLLKALRSFYAALGAFAGAALLLGLGSVVAASEYPRAFWFLATVAITIGAAAVVGLAYGCVQMVRETGLAVRNLSEEAQLSGAGQ